MKIPRIYNDADGKSHFGEAEIPLKDGGPIGLLSEKIPAGSIIFRETPADYNFKWHPAPARQLLFILKGGKTKMMFFVKLTCSVEATFT